MNTSKHRHDGSAYDANRTAPHRSGFFIDTTSKLAL